MTDRTADQMSIELEGKIVDVGLSGDVNEVVLLVGKDQQISIRGLSNALTKQFAKRLYETCRVSAEVLT